MAKPKERFLKELYDATQIISQPEITPVLEGSCRMQGPIDEVVCSIRTDTVSFKVDKGFSRASTSQKLHLRTESGTCNVCSAPCSSCLHVTRALMGSKSDEFSDEPYRENTLSYSVDDIATTVKRRTYEIGQRATSITSNLMSLSSSHDSLSENAESKANLRTSDVSGAPEHVEISPRLLSHGTPREGHHSLKPKCYTTKIDPINKFDDPRSLEGHDDNISRVSGADDASILSSSATRNSDRIKLPCSTSVVSLVSERYGKNLSSQTASHSGDVKFDVVGSQNYSSRHSIYNEERNQKESPSSKSSKFSSHHSVWMDNPSSNDAGNCIGSGNAQSTSFDPPRGNFVSCDSNSKDLVEDSCSHLQEDAPECPSEDRSCFLRGKKEVCDTQKSASCDCGKIENSKISFSGSNHEDILEIRQKSKEGAHSDSGDLPKVNLNSQEQGREEEKVRDEEKVGDLLGLPDAKESSLQSHHVNDSDDSDVVEHDVKVCDICGDAGREDLLAICCRCSDGAEHTYCMREMLDKVPEGDWLCEECKLDDENKKQKQDKFNFEVGFEKDQSSGHANTETARSVKADVKSSDIEGNRTSKSCLNAKISVKRHADETEVSSAAKKQAVELIIGSPKATSPSRTHALSRDSSFKELDSGKLKPTLQFASGTHFANDTPEVSRSRSGGSLQNSRGAFFKSNSFNMSKAKPKVKLVDEVVLQKQKSMKEPASRDTKEGPVRGIGKSMSFKASNSGRFNVTEPKVKMLSPNFSHVQDQKGSKHKIERNLFERKNSFKSPRPLVNPATSGSTISAPKVDKKLHCESVSFSSTSNHESKVVQSDSKSMAMSKSTNHATRVGAEAPASTGEVKRQWSTDGVSNSGEPKPVQSSLKDDLLSNLSTTENGILSAQESANLAERMKDSSNHPRESISAGTTSIPCQKCKEVGHSAQYCTVDSPGSPVLDVSASRSSTQVINKGNKLKAAIEAAMLKKPVIYRKNRMTGQSEELSISSVNNETGPSQDILASSSNNRSMIGDEEVFEGHAKTLQNSSSDYGEQMNGNTLKQSMALPAEASTFRTGDGSSMAPSEGKHFTMELPSQNSVDMSFPLKMSAFPDYDYIWQGTFEVHRSGKPPGFWDGFQAHLSTCASPRVSEAVNKLPRKILLNEVPRLSAWPIQFLESGVQEDNIGLYFFAKDLESYERSYKILLEGMMTSDLALKGNIDGVEILIFPSNLLPEKSHRWNMLFFLWGVFRGKRENCLQHVPGSPKKYCVSQVIPTAMRSLPDNSSLPGSMDKNLPMCERARVLVPEAPSLIELPCLSSLESKSGNCDAKVSSLVQNDSCLQMDEDQQNCKRYCKLSGSAKLSLWQSYPEMRCVATPTEGNVDWQRKSCGELRASMPAVTSAYFSNTNMNENMKIHCLSSPLDRQLDSSDCINKVPDGAEDMASLRSITWENVEMQSRMNSSRDIVNGTTNPRVEEGYLEAESALDREWVMGVETIKELTNLQCNPRKRPCLGPTEDTADVAFDGTSRINPLNSLLVDEGSTSKKQNSGLSEWNNYHTSSLGDGFASRIHDWASSSPIKGEKGCDEPCKETAILMTSRNNGERYFFPVDPPCQVEDVVLGGRFSTRIGSSSSDNIDGRLQDRVPNLELALGAELKPSKQEMFPFLVGKVDDRLNQEEPPPDKSDAKKGVVEDDAVASLSLSLSFPFPDKDRGRGVQDVSKTEQLMR